MARAKKRRFADETPPELRWPLGPLPTGVLLFTLALVALLALAFPDGALSGWLSALLKGGLGEAGYLVPLLLVGLGLAAWLPPTIPPERLGREAIASWLAALACLAALLQPIAGRPAPSWEGRGGGLLGWLVQSGLESLLGPASAAVVLGGGLAVALCFAAGVGPRDFALAGRAGVAWLGQRLRSKATAETLTISAGIRKPERRRLALALPKLRRDEVEPIVISRPAEIAPAEPRPRAEVPAGARVW